MTLKRLEPKKQISCVTHLLLHVPEYIFDISRTTFLSHTSGIRLDHNPFRYRIITNCQTIESNYNLPAEMGSNKSAGMT